MDCYHWRNSIQTIFLVGHTAKCIVIQIMNLSFHHLESRDMTNISSKTYVAINIVDEDTS